MRNKTKIRKIKIVLIFGSENEIDKIFRKMCVCKTPHFGVKSETVR